MNMTADSPDYYFASLLLWLSLCFVSSLPHPIGGNCNCGESLQTWFDKPLKQHSICIGAIFGV